MKTATKKPHPLIRAINVAVAFPKQIPDEMALAVLRNNLREAITLATQYDYSLVALHLAVRHVYNQIPTNQIEAVVNHWKK